jgi:pimeloyl-ACP methyl ester carboxylesterase
VAGEKPGPRRTRQQELEEKGMPSFEHDGATIYYEETGRGFPILAFAPGGLLSTIEYWRRPASPVNPMTAFGSDFRVIAMDQRNAGGQSRAPITAQDGWETFTSDHIALLDHLGIEQCHLYGQCIGGPFILSLIKAQPQRVVSAVIAQPHRAGRSDCPRALGIVHELGREPEGPP